MRFEGKIALVTGASQGIGETIAAGLAREGAVVALVDVQKEKLDAVAGRLAAEGGTALAIAADVTSSEQAKAAVDAVVAAHGRLDFLVNNAGITRDNLFLRMKDEEWDAVLAVNLKGTYNFCKAAIRPMVAARGGRIVNIASVVGLMGNAGQANYAASKAGVIALSKSLAREVAARGITVNCVAPGYIETAMTGQLADEIKQAFLQIIPMKRFGLPKDVSAAVEFLLSDAAAYVTGQVLGVNGGMYM